MLTRLGARARMSVSPQNIAGLRAVGPTPAVSNESDSEVVKRRAR